MISRTSIPKNPDSVNGTGKSPTADNIHTKTKDAPYIESAFFDPTFVHASAVWQVHVSI
jgi:hypothetical protein